MQKDLIRKKPYEAPMVEEIGSVSGLTQGPLNGSIDGLVGANGGFAS